MIIIVKIANIIYFIFYFLKFIFNLFYFFIFSTININFVYYNNYFYLFFKIILTNKFVTIIVFIKFII